MIIKNVDINLNDTVSCGQCFRWNKEDDNSFTIILKDRVINIYQDNNQLVVDSNNNDNLERIVKEYFDLYNNYDEINKCLIKNCELEKYISNSKGFKIINQDPFETLISYIISQNNNVKRIMRSIDLLCKDYGKQITFKDNIYYLFPDYEDLKDITLNQLKTYGVGFRDKYIFDTLLNITNGKLDLELINKMNSEEATNYLKLNKGIGSKVASCILLFSYKRYDVFPIDTWVKKCFLKEYPNIKNTQKEISLFAKEKYGKYSGIALQYLYHYKRNKNSN